MNEMKVHELDLDVQSRMQSGLTITDATQCVLELVENSLDANAGAVAIRVNLDNYTVEVVDNGVGMLPEDLNLIGRRFMTSKCSKAEDLKKNLLTYGYRGQALASLVDLCSTLTIKTKSKMSETTVVKIFKNGKPLPIVISEKEKSGSGTTVTICDFMCTMPVRRKRLSEVFDLQSIKNQLEYLAVIHNQVCFTLRDEKKGEILLQTHRRTDPRLTFSDLFGLTVEKFLVHLDFSQSKIQINGFISRRRHTESNLQFVYVNKRIVFKSLIHKLINRLIDGYLRENNFDLDEWLILKEIDSNTSKNIYNIFVVQIQCPYSYFEMFRNMRKTMVEFVDWDQILKCVKCAIRSAFRGPEVDVSSGSIPANENLHKKLVLRKKFSQGRLENGLIGAAVKRKRAQDVVNEKKSKTGEDPSREWKELTNAIQDPSEGKKLSPSISLQICRSTRNLVEISTPKEMPSNFTEGLDFSRRHFSSVSTEERIRFFDFLFQFGIWFGSKVNTNSNSLKIYDEFVRYYLRSLSSSRKIEDFREVLEERKMGRDKHRVSKMRSIGTGGSKQKGEGISKRKFLGSVESKTHDSKEKVRGKSMKCSKKQLERTERKKVNSRCRRNESENERKERTIPVSAKADRYRLTHGMASVSDSGPLATESIPSPRYWHHRNHVFFREMFRENVPQFFFDANKVSSCKERRSDPSRCEDPKMMALFKTSVVSKQIQTSFSVRDKEVQIPSVSVPTYSDGRIQTCTECLGDDNEFQKLPVSPVSTRGCGSNREIKLARCVFTETTFSDNCDNSQLDEGFPKAGLSNKQRAVGSSETDRIEGRKSFQVTRGDVRSCELETKTHSQPILMEEEGGGENNFIEGRVAEVDPSSHTTNFIPNSSKLNVTGNVVAIGSYNMRTHLPDTISVQDISVNNPSFSFSGRYSFLPKGLSQTVFEKSPSEGHLDGGKSNADGLILEGSVLPEIMDELQKKTDEKMIYYEKDIASSTVRKPMLKINVLDGYKITKEILSDIKIVGQWDKKFIIAVLDISFPDMTLLTLLDQHAVDERIQLERLLKEFRNDAGQFTSQNCCPTTKCTLKESTIRVLSSLENILMNYGFSVSVYDPCTLSILKAPSFLVNELNDEKVETVLKKLLYELTEEFHETRGSVPAIPRVFYEAISTRACRSAVKFNTVLTVDEIKSMVADWMDCQAPFLCAHGRPSIVPIVDLRSVGNQVKPVPKLNFAKFARRKLVSDHPD